MNPADLRVKESMLEYASVFPTRLAVLRHMFFVLGNGYDWLEDGTIGSHYQEPKRDLPEGIDVEHLNERIANYEAEDSDFAKRKLVELKAEKAARLATFANIDFLATHVDPKGEIKGGHYGELSNILRDLGEKNYTGRPYLKIWNVPANVEPSWWAAACEAMEAAIRGSISPDDRQYARLCWNAMTDFVEGRAEAFVTPVKPETHAERQARLSAENDVRVAAHDEAKRIQRILNRAGYALDMKSKHREETHSSNGTFSMSVFKATALTDETIAKIDRAMIKAGYTRTDNADLPTWENGKPHRVALRLFPFTAGLWKARILVIGYPDDENGNRSEKKYFARAQEYFDRPDEGSEYVAPPPPPPPPYEGPIHQVLPGSMEVNGLIVQAGVHTGTHEWDIQNIRYVRVDTSTITDKTRTIQSVLSEVYENSVGCMVNGGFVARSL